MVFNDFLGFCLCLFGFSTSQDYPSPLSPLTVNRNQASRTILITLSCPSFAMIIHHCRNFVRNFTSGPRACEKFINFKKCLSFFVYFFDPTMCFSKRRRLRWRGSNTSLQIAKPWRFGFIQHHSITIGIHWYHFKMLSYTRPRDHEIGPFLVVFPSKHL